MDYRNTCARKGDTHAKIERRTCRTVWSQNRFVTYLEDDLGRRVVGADETADVHVRPVFPAVLDLLSHSAGKDQTTAARIRTRYQARPHRYQPLEYGSRLLNMLSIRMLTSACNWERTGTCKSTPSGDSIPVHHQTLHSAYAKPTLLARMCQTPLTTSIRIKKQKGYAVAQFGCLD